MPTIKDKLNFNYDGRWSSDFGMIHVVLDSGMYQESLISARAIVENKVRGNNKPYFSGIEEEPITFEMNIAFENGYTDKLMDDVIMWLFGDYYKPLYFEGREDRVFYCMPEGEPYLFHNGMNEGYITITMRCNSSNVYSPISITPLYTIIDNATKVIDVYNNGHYTIYPEISIEKIGDGKITIISKNDGGAIFEILNLKNTESIYINCEKEIIESNSLTNKYKYNDVLGNYIRLAYGRNTFEIIGNCKIQMRYYAKYRF